MGRFGLAFAAFAFGAQCSACTVFYPSVDVGPNFRVSVNSEGHPVKGLPLKVQGKRAVTDNDGFAYFRNMAPGFYGVEFERDDGVSDGATLIVKPDGPANVTVPLRWPTKPPLAVRSLKGTLHASGYLPGQPDATVGVDLLEGLSGRNLKSTQTTDDGAFDFADTAPGLYFLRVNNPLEGFIAVEVDPKAPADHLDIELGSSSCGLYYSDRIQCSTGELYVQQLCGRVVDPAGAAIADADIFLYHVRATPTLIKRTRSNGPGEFSIPTSVTGIYELIITSPGFTTLRKQLHIEASDEPTCSRPLKVELGVFGNCSTVQ